MEGIYFYWIVWIFWICSTFLLAKTNKRLAITFFLLLLIIFSNSELTIFTFNVNSTILLCLFSGYLIVSLRRRKIILYYFSVSLILTISFMTFRLFQLYDPVWIMFNPTVKLSMILLLLILLLVRDQSIRIGLLFITVAQGDIFYQLFLNNSVAEISLDQFEALDIISITIGGSYIWYFFEQFVKWLEAYTKQKLVILRLNE